MASEKPDRSLQVLCWVSGVNTLVAICMISMGVAMTVGLHEFRTAHEHTGSLMLLTSLLATVAAVWFARGGQRGVAMHAGGVFVLTILQTGLGEMSLTGPHIVLGVVVGAGAVALSVLALRRLSRGGTAG